MQIQYGARPFRAG